MCCFLIPKHNQENKKLVPEEGVEPIRPCDQRILSAMRVIVTSLCFRVLVTLTVKLCK